MQTPQLLYRVYRNDRLDDLGNFVSINIPLESGNAGEDATWANLSNQANLLSSINSPGTYTVQLYFQASVTNGSTSSSTITDSNNGQLYAATFNVNVNGSAIQPISWNTTNNNGSWFNANNWTPNVIPNSNTDVTIPVISGGTYPVIDGVLPAQVRNVLIARRGQIAAQLSVNSGAQLFIYGNFQDAGNGFKQNGGSITLAGTNQTFDASSSLTLYDLRITGGGVKTLTNSLTIAN
ncbi:MAG: hypothetical protein EOO61_16635 [Hymenobacter sp.]|nr:MAG: hypothetical protein EOO61_16635 [Hymenobacter sp.]